MVPLKIGPLNRVTVLDIVSSVTLLNETVWTGVKGQQELQNPWVRGPSYLAEGEETAVRMVGN